MFTQIGSSANNLTHYIFIRYLSKMCRP